MGSDTDGERDAFRGFTDKKEVLAIMQDCPLPAKLALSSNLIDGEPTR